MFITVYPTAREFLLKAQPELERNEVANALMLGICFRLDKYPERIDTPPYLATIEDEHGLIIATSMTPPHNIIVYGARDDVDEALGMLVENLRANHWPIPGAIGAVPIVDTFARVWSNVTGQTARRSMNERVFELDKVVAPPPAPGRLRVATEDDYELVKKWLTAFRDEAGGGEQAAPVEQVARGKITDREIYLWELPDGSVVSLAGKTRPVLHVISVGPVYTPPEARGKGYASNCVAALSQLLLDQGWRYCSLFTDLANPVSNSIYQKIGYRPVCDYNMYIFE